MAGRAALVTALAVFAACGSSTEPRANDAIGVAVHQAQFADVTNFSSSQTQFVLLPALGAAPFDPATCAFSSAMNAFACKPVTVAYTAYVHTLSYAILDGSGMGMSRFDAARSDALRITTDVNGALLGSVVHHHDEATISGLLNGPRTIRGTAVDHDTTTAGAAPSAMMITDAIGTTSGVVFAGASSDYPTSGSIVTDVTTTFIPIGGPVLASTTRYVLTFTGEGGATAVEQIAGLDYRTCVLDLTGTRPPSCTTIHAP